MLVVVYLAFPAILRYGGNHRTQTMRMVGLIARLTEHHLTVLWRATHLAQSAVRALPPCSHS